MALTFSNTVSVTAPDVSRTGSEINIQSHFIQDVDGSARTVRAQIIESYEKEGVYSIKARVLGDLGDVSRFRRIAPDRLRGVEYSAASYEDQQTYCAMVDPSSATFDNGDPAHRIM